MSQTIELYTAQTDIVYDTIKEQGIYLVKKKYVEEKYKEVAPSMLKAYNWFAEKLSALVAKPDGAELPVWHFQDQRYAKVHMSQQVKLLKIPEDQVLLFDNKGWERVLSLDYVGLNEADQRKFAEKLERMGLDCGYRVFEKPFYPHIRKEIENSWSRIFTLTETSIIRGATWMIDSEWIESKEV